MKNKQSLRLAGIAGILSAILFILSIIGLQYFLAADLNDVSAFTQNMMDSHNMMLLYGWPGLFATLLIIPLIYALHQSNESSKFVSKMVFLIVVIGLCFVLIGYIFHLALTYFHAPAYQTLNVEQQATFGAVFKTTIGLQDMFWLSGDLFSFLGIAFLMYLGLKEGFFPKWMLIFGLVAGVLAATGSVSFIPAFKKIPGLSFLFIGGFSLFALWEIAAGIFLIKKSKQ